MGWNGVGWCVENFPPRAQTHPTLGGLVPRPLPGRFSNQSAEISCLGYCQDYQPICRKFSLIDDLFSRFVKISGRSVEVSG